MDPTSGQKSRLSGIRRSLRTVGNGERDEGHYSGVPLVIGAVPPATYSWLVALIVPTQAVPAQHVPTPTVPTHYCDVDPESTPARLMGERPKMLSGSAVRWVVTTCLAGVAGLSLVLGLIGSNVDRPDRSLTDPAVQTIWLTGAAGTSLNRAGSGQWLLRAGTGDCVVAAQVNTAGQLQLVPTDPANPACTKAALAAR